MKQINPMLFRTLSCRTSRLSAPVDPQKALMALALLGTVLGTLLRTWLSADDGLPVRLLSQGLQITSALRTLWDVYRCAALPMLVLLCVLLLSASSACGQPLALLVLLLRGIGAGTALADCFLRYPQRDALVLAAALILPYSFFTVLILIRAMLHCMRLSLDLTRCLFRGQPDADITEHRQAMCSGLLKAALLTLLTCGLHTAAVWLLNDRLTALS